jgi:hypothetical protein
MMQTVYAFADGISGYGSPFENRYSQNHSVWVRSKSGSNPGYSSMMSIIPELQFGIFTCVLQSSIPDPTSSAYVFPILDVVLPVVTQVLWEAQPPPTLPQNYQLFLGNYAYVLNVTVVNNTLVGLPLIPGSSAFKFAEFLPDEYIMRVDTLDASALPCEVDASSQPGELAYGRFNATTGEIVGVSFMGMYFPKVGV